MTLGRQALPSSLDSQSEKGELRGSRLTRHLTSGKLSGGQGRGGLRQPGWKRGEVGLNQCAGQSTVASTGGTGRQGGGEGGFAPESRFSSLQSNPEKWQPDKRVPLLNRGKLSVRPSKRGEIFCAMDDVSLGPYYWHSGDIVACYW